MAVRIKSLSKTFVWIILGLLIVGLAGFGATNLSGTVRTVAVVGERTVSVDDFARELQREIRAIEAQSGQALPMSRVQETGLDQQVLGRLIALAALDHEAGALGLSIGDENLHREIVRIPAFQGIDGKFDREAYRFALEGAGLKETAFESDMRADSARTLVQSAIVGGVEMPEILASTLTDYIAARRSFTWVQLDETALAEPLPAPSEDELRAWYDAHPDDFMLPETKQLSYVLLSPEMLVDQVELDETALRELYDQRSEEFIQLERRLVERLVFADDAAAQQALARIESGETDFETLVQDRGLELGDIDLGDLARDDLDGAADAVFAAEINQVVGPLPSDLGPALFRVNGILEARETAFEDALPQLREELAAARARRLIETRAQDIDDMLAAGATLEDLARETGMELGKLDWAEGSAEGVAAYNDFRDGASAATTDDFPTVAFLDDGSIFALRVNEVLPPRPQPFDDARASVTDAWAQQQTAATLQAQAEQVIAALPEGQRLGDAGLDVKVETGLTRSVFLNGTPPDFMAQVFAMDVDAIRTIPGEGNVTIVQLDAVLPPEDSNDMAELRRALGQELDQTLANALFEAYALDVRLRANPKLDERALNAVRASFR